MRRQLRKCVRLQVEQLESRLAPATLINPTTMTYTDVDGDLVTVTTTKGTFTLSNPNGGNPGDTFTLVGALGQQLQLIDLTNGNFTGANIAITAKPNRPP